MAVTIIIVTIFVIGYLMIALEHPLHIDKTAPALMIGVLTWAVFAIAVTHFGYTLDFSSIFHHLEIFDPGGSHGGDAHGAHAGDHGEGVPGHHYVDGLLRYFIADISYILFFLLGAMTIVELIDMHDGFHLITSRIQTSNKRKVLWIVCVLTFFLSAVLDNLTTSIVMASLLRKLIKDRPTRLIFASMVVISANAGGAWSPIGDITTTMLWIGGQITTGPTIVNLILPSLVCMAVPVAIMSYSMKGNFDHVQEQTVYKTTPFERTLILFVGVGCLLFVPVFKTVTHLPPYMGMLFGLSLLWFLTEFIHKQKEHTEKSQYSVLRALAKIDTPSVLFFLGILSAVACLESIGVLEELALWLDHTVGNETIIVMLIGVLSAIVDNVPLVAASMGMYEIQEAGSLMQDGYFWQFVAYCAGTGGSMLIIGSAAGVAVMGIERIDFIWYMRKFTILAFIGYVAGALVYIAQYNLLN
jgi:Na+/H+ antiporter NhaD/arsenite permease-like protein